MQKLNMNYTATMKELGCSRTALKKSLAKGTIREFFAKRGYTFHSMETVGKREHFVFSKKETPEAEFDEFIKEKFELAPQVDFFQFKALLMSVIKVRELTEDEKVLLANMNQQTMENYLTRLKEKGLLDDVERVYYKDTPQGYQKATEKQSRAWHYLLYSQGADYEQLTKSFGATNFMSQLEYQCCVWNPIREELKEALEK